MAFTLGDDQRFDLVIQAVDDAGNPVPATFATPPAWSSSDDSVVGVSASADGTTGTVVAAGKIGSATVSVNADGGAAGTLALSFDIDVVATAEVGFKLVPSEPAHK